MSEADRQEAYPPLLETRLWDLHDCDPDLIRDHDAIVGLAVRFCEILETQPTQEGILAVRFGAQGTPLLGFSLICSGESGDTISGHFSEAWNAAYIDVTLMAQRIKPLTDDQQTQLIALPAAHFRSRQPIEKAHMIRD